MSKISVKFFIINNYYRYLVWLYQVKFEYLYFTYKQNKSLFLKGKKQFCSINTFSLGTPWGFIQSENLAFNQYSILNVSYGLNIHFSFLFTLYKICIYRNMCTIFRKKSSMLVHQLILVLYSYQIHLVNLQINVSKQKFLRKKPSRLNVLGPREHHLQNW